VGPDEKTDSYDAAEFLDRLNVNGGDWKLPSIKELETLYKKGNGKNNLPSIFKTSGHWVWSRTQATYRHSEESGFDFKRGEKEELQRGSAWKGSRAFAVRPSKK